MLPPKNKIALQDCVAGMRALPPACADIIIADPPYNIGKDFGNDSDRRSLEDYIAWTQQWLAEALRALKPRGTLFVYGFDEILAHISVLLPPQKQRWLTWYYTNKNIPSLHFWQRSHESILCIWQEKPHFNRDAVREPYTENFLRGCAGRIRPKTQGRYAKNGGRETRYQAHDAGALPRDVLALPTLAGGAALKERLIYCKSCGRAVAAAERKAHSGHDVVMHPTQKPQALSERLIKSCRPQGAFHVLVPFCGSGSECLAALKNGGSFTAYELNADYALLARAHIALRQSENSGQ